MYDEFERAVTGKNGQKLSFLAWLSIAVGTLFALGIVAAGLTAVRVKSQIAEIAHVIEHQIESPSDPGGRGHGGEAGIPCFPPFDSSGGGRHDPPGSGVRTPLPKPSWRSSSAGPWGFSRRGRS